MRGEAQQLFVLRPIQSECGGAILSLKSRNFDNYSVTFGTTSNPMPSLSTEARRRECPLMAESRHSADQMGEKK